MDAKLAPVPPIVALGRNDDYLYAAFTMEEVIEHANGSSSAGVPVRNDMVDFFDATGRLLAPFGEAGESQAFSVTGSTEYQELRERVRRVVTRKTEEGAIDPANPQNDPDLEALLRVLDESTTFEELANQLAMLLREPEGSSSVTPGLVSPSLRPMSNGESRHGSWLHDIFCH